MKKCIYVLSIIVMSIIILYSVTFEVKAHPGRTDSNGGHTNRSTGEYHYHHGYSAHDHYDMDGDGDVDCPYNFDDQTSHSIKSSQSSKEPSKPATEESSEPEPKKDYTPILGGILSVGLYVFLMFILPCLLRQ